MERKFTNENRDRYYGIRIGDIVSIPEYKIDIAEVVDYGIMDNNKVRVNVNGTLKYVIAEWCEILLKAEDRIGNAKLFRYWKKVNGIITSEAYFLITESSPLLKDYDAHKSNVFVWAELIDHNKSDAPKDFDFGFEEIEYPTNKALNKYKFDILKEMAIKLDMLNQIKLIQNAQNSKVRNKNN